MMTVAHAWTGLMALQRLKSLQSSFDSHYKKQVADFLKFFDKHKDAFVQGAWFPDSVISDNLTGGHTYKLKKPDTNQEKDKASVMKNRTPGHLSCQTWVKNELPSLDNPLFCDSSYTLPDRCEALSHSIRDMILIQKKEQKGSDIIFNDNQITLYFLMLGHYICDAHVPPHCDSRDFYKPSTIHPDMEEWWDDEILKYYTFDKTQKVFDYDIDGNVELKDGVKASFEKSFLYEALRLLDSRKWSPSDKGILGKNNVKIYDYLKSVCLVSYLVSTKFIPVSMTKSQYDKLNILKDQPYFDQLKEISRHIFADAIDSVALVWILTWDKYNKLQKDIEQKKEEIAKENKNNPA